MVSSLTIRQKMKKNKSIVNLTTTDIQFFMYVTRLVKLYSISLRRTKKKKKKRKRRMSMLCYGMISRVESSFHQSLFPGSAEVLSRQNVFLTVKFDTIRVSSHSRLPNTLYYFSLFLNRVRRQPEIH